MNEGNTQLSEFQDSWIMAWLESWCDSPIGAGHPVNLEMMVDKIDLDGSTFQHSIQVELNTVPGVALVYEDDELLYKIIHHEHTEDTQ